MCYFGEALKQQQGAPPECFFLSRECGYREVPRHATARRPAALDVAGAQSGLGSCGNESSVAEPEFWGDRGSPAHPLCLIRTPT